MSIGWRVLLVALIAIASMVIALGPTAARGEPRISRGSEYRSGKLLVRWRSDMSAVERSASLATAGAGEHSEIPGIGVHRVTVPDGQELAKLEKLRQDPRVLYAEPDYIATADWLPNDPGLGSQWGLTRVSAASAWDWATGEGVTVAVVDTGADLSHPDLAPNLVSGYNFVADNGTPSDDNSHGSHVAGIIAATANNSTGGVGIAPRAKIMPLKALGADGKGYYSDIAQAIRYAADRGAQVVNLSLGGGSDSRTMREAIDYAWTKGLIVVAAAGNANTSTPSYPAAYVNAIAVASSDSRDVKSSFSNYGSYVDITAPGSAIYSTVPGGYAQYSGTSMATPFVAGAAALAFSIPGCPGLTNASVRRAIEAGADNIYQTNPSYAGQLGSGRLNALRALPAPDALTIESNAVSFLVQAQSSTLHQRSIAVNTGSCVAPWNAAAGGGAAQAGWLSTTTSDSPRATVTVTVDPRNMSPGSYEAGFSVGYVAQATNRQTVTVTVVAVPHLSAVVLPAVTRASD